jgi:hypothetical protein
MGKSGPKFTVPRGSKLRRRRKGAASDEPLAIDYVVVEPWDEDEALQQFRDVVRRWRF